ncbi:MAG TPA: PaaI family thioesterase [Pyrinomonadaceae bacterium]|jgi:uncharacterized protein (TIGR00369 family)
MSAAELTGARQQSIREALEKVPFAALLGIKIGKLEPGAATLYLEIRDELKQNNGLLHGGVTASLVDTAAAFAILTVLEPGQTTTTIDLTIHYLRPLTAGRASATARVVRSGRRLIILTIDVLDNDGNLAATALTSFMRLA